METSSNTDENPWRQKDSATNDVNDEDAENPEEVLRDCAEKFATPDYIMEPGIFQQLKRYFQAGGEPATVIDELSKNYMGVAQITNLLAEYLIISGTEAKDVQSMVENHMKDLIVKNFDPKKADTIFTEEGETPAWLTELIKHNTWRSLIYRLAEEYGDCLMLNFTVKLIADAGFQGEITSITTAAQQIEVFSRVIKTSVLSFLKNLDNWQKSSHDFSKMVCFGQHTYVYSQVLLQILSKESNGGNYMKRLSQEIARHAKEIGYDVTAITMSLNGTSVYTQACEALSSMLSRNTLNPADISVLFRSYSSDDPPPVELIRNPHFLELLIQALFKPGFKINPEHKSKYVYMLAFATSVYEIITKKTATKFLNKDDLEATILAIETVHQIVNSNKGSSELIADVGTLYQALKFPVVSLGIIKWVEVCVTEPSYFQLSTEHCPTHLALLDEICTSHPLLHSQVLDLLVTLFESKHDNLEILVQLEKRKMLLDRMIHLLCSGYVIPVVKYVKKCWQNNDTDMSLIRYFVTEVLDSIGPPYTAEFVREFLPMVNNEEITGSMRGGCDDYVSEFICHCNVHYR